MEFTGVLVFAAIWLLVVMPLSKRTADQNKQKAARQAAARMAAKQQARSGQAAPAGEPAPKAAQDSLISQPMSRIEGAPEMRSSLRPTISVTEHDDSIYQGSLNAVTGEGYDPCHDEQLESLTAAEAAVPAAASEVPGLRLEWNGSEIVKGLVMSEILKRK